MTTPDPTRTHLSSSVLKGRLRRVRDRLAAGLVERELPIRLALLAALAGEHLLLIGPPGTAKSLLARRLHLAFRDAGYFEYLLTRFSVPEELFGPLSIQALERDEYRRKVDGYLPTATIAFLDEIFKANSAILNALLTLLNEREFDNGGVRRRTPLVSVVGASNELPESEELDALYDRFLLRLHVDYVSEAGFDALLDLRGEEVPALPSEDLLDVDLVAAVRAGARAVVIPPNVRDLLRHLRRWAQQQQIPVSDRRWRKIVGLLQVAAYTDGRDEVSLWDGWLLQFCACDEPEQRELVQRWYEDVVGKTETEDPRHVTAIVVTWEKRLAQHQARESQAMDARGRPLFRRPDGKATTAKVSKSALIRGHEPLYLLPPDLAQARDRQNGGRGWTQAEIDQAWHTQTSYSYSNWPNRSEYYADPANRLMGAGAANAPLLEAMRYAEAHVADLVRQVDDVRARVRGFVDHLDEHLRTLDASIEGHLWVEAAFAATARTNLDRVRATAVGLSERADRVREGFEGLPRLVDVVDADDAGVGSEEP